jgi:hypothetical protein
MVDILPANFYSPSAAAPSSPIKPRPEFGIHLEGLAKIHSSVEKAYQRPPIEILGDKTFSNASELRDFVYKEVERIASGLAPDEVGLYCIDGNRFIIGGTNFQGIADGKILAGRALDAYLQQTGAA